MAMLAGVLLSTPARASVVCPAPEHASPDGFGGEYCIAPPSLAEQIVYAPFFGVGLLVRWGGRWLYGAPAAAAFRGANIGLSGFSDPAPTESTSAQW